MVSQNTDIKVHDIVEAVVAATQQQPLSEYLHKQLAAVVAVRGLRVRGEREAGGFGWAGGAGGETVEHLGRSTPLPCRSLQPTPQAGTESAGQPT